MFVKAAIRVYKLVYLATVGQFSFDRYLQHGGGDDVTHHSCF